MPGTTNSTRSFLEGYNRKFLIVHYNYVEGAETETRHLPHQVKGAFIRDF